MATNAPVTGDDTVPSAAAERRREWRDDTKGIRLYAIAIVVVCGLILAILVFA